MRINKHIIGYRLAQRALVDDYGFNRSPGGPIYKNMKTYWYSDQESNVEFWKHEWYKHGTCSGYKFIDYFFVKTS